MKRFRFALEPVLRQRLAAEREAQKITAQHERERIAIEHEIETLEMLGRAERQDLIGRLGVTGSIHAGELRQQSAAAAQLHRRVREAALRLVGVHHRLERSRVVLARATAARRAIELIRDRQLAEYRAREERAETQHLDELAMMLKRSKRFDERSTGHALDGDAA